MDELSAMFSRLTTPEIIADAESSHRRDMSPQNRNIRVHPPDPISEMKSQSRFASIDIEDDDKFRAAFKENMIQNPKRFPPLERLPCSNIQVKKYKTCPNQGTRACSACKLVSYCSKV
jgi:hypothetical protein